MSAAHTIEGPERVIEVRDLVKTYRLIEFNAP
jgi:hypothetical protein